MLSKSKKGFTIIEVVIVLVIGAIIMLMVFLVVPALQRSQRDARRQSDARRFLAAAEQYATNNSGSYPPATTAGVSAVVTDYIKDAFKDPSTNNTYVYGTTVAAGNLVYALSSKCTNNTATAISPAENNKISIVVFQESGSSFCVNN